MLTVYQVTVGVALTRPPAVDEWRNILVAADSPIQARQIACQIAACTSTMPVVVDGWWPVTGRKGEPMSYDEWGAFVYRSGWRCDDRENTPVFPLPGETARHAVLGDALVRVAVHMNRPELWHRTDDVLVRVDLDQYIIDLKLPAGARQNREWHGNYEGYTFTVRTWDDEDMIIVELYEPNGTGWQAVCGYRFGSGHMG